MKLFRKIFLRVMVGILVFTQVFFIWFLLESHKQNLEDVHIYESTAVYNRKNEMRNQLQKAKIMQESKEIQNLTAINILRNVFMRSAVLYRDGEEIYNATPYEFDYNRLKNRSDLEAYSSKPLSPDSIQSIGDRKLLLYKGEIKEEKCHFFFVSYKDVTDIYLRTRDLFIKGLGFTLILLLAIGSLLFLSIYRTIRPLAELKDAAVAIAEGNYEKRISISNKKIGFGTGWLRKNRKSGKSIETIYGKEDEIKALAVSFNQMAEKVQNHTEKLMQTNEMQRQLLGSLAHELKTPMTAIIGYADTLLTVRLTDKRREQALTYIENECRRLSRLSAKMLELTGLYETGENAVEFHEIKAADLLEKLKNLMGFRLEAKGIQLEISCTPENLILRVDEDLMMSLLMNLVDNAYKASPENSRIFVGAEEQGIYVSDQGKGMPVEEICHVTEAFYMIDKSRSRSAGSVGLGLTLCKKIAELHGASLGIESEEGVGTTVSLIWRRR